jgi:hypothetical protein
MPDEKDQKDRLGDTLHKKERGEEEKYFAEQERIRLARLRERLHATTYPRTAGSCSRCGRTLVPSGRPPTDGECDGGCARR